jgi:siroheme synthase-like protein
MRFRPAGRQRKPPNRHLPHLFPGTPPDIIPFSRRRRYNSVAMYYPVMMRLDGAKCLVVGGGPVAYRKAVALRRAGAKVHVVAPEFLPRFRRLRGVTLVAGRYRAHHLRGVRLAIGATDDAAVHRRLYEACRARGIPVNVVDVPELCTFIVPSVVRRGPITLAISTGGASPGSARELRRRIERLIPPRAARIVRELERTRRRIQRAIPDPSRRLRALRRATARAWKRLVGTAARP